MYLWECKSSHFYKNAVGSLVKCITLRNQAISNCSQSSGSASETEPRSCEPMKKQLKKKSEHKAVTKLREYYTVMDKIRRIISGSMADLIPVRV